MLGKLCTGVFSDETQQSLVSYRNRAQWQMYPCETCKLQVGARQEKGRWIPEDHWLSVRYTPRVPRISSRRAESRTVAPVR